MLDIERLRLTDDESFEAYCKIMPSMHPADRHIVGDWPDINVRCALQGAQLSKALWGLASYVENLCGDFERGTAEYDTLLSLYAQVELELESAGIPRPEGMNVSG